MAVIENRATEIGDVIRIKTEVPVIGLLFLTTFSDSVEEQLEASFFKQFRYSNDGGLNFTEWVDLNILNIQGVSVERKDQFILEYRYEATGTSIGSGLIFNSITVSGEFENLEYPIYDTTLFKKFFDVNDINVLGWALNVLEKLYRSGILPEYIKRNDDSSNNVEDRDFIVFWNSVTHFFALIVYFYRQYENIASNKELIKEFLQGKDIQIPVNENLEDLSYLLYNYISEYRRRGTERIVYKKDQNGEQIDGELLRLIGFVEPDEFIFALLEPKDTGLCVGHSSPCWKGTEGIVNLIKAYEYAYGFTDITKYPLIGSSYVSLINNELVLSNQGTLDSAGIGMDVLDQTKLIKVDSGIDYTISAEVSKNVLDDDNIRFDCLAYDKDFNQVNLVPLSDQNEDYVNSFVGAEPATSPVDQLDILRNDVEYFVPTTSNMRTIVSVDLASVKSDLYVFKDSSKIVIGSGQGQSLTLFSNSQGAILLGVKFSRDDLQTLYNTSNFTTFTFNYKLNNFSAEMLNTSLYVLKLDLAFRSTVFPPVFPESQTNWKEDSVLTDSFSFVSAGILNFNSVEKADGSFVMKYNFSVENLPEYKDIDIYEYMLILSIRRNPFIEPAQSTINVPPNISMDIFDFKVFQYLNENDWKTSGLQPNNILRVVDSKYILSGCLKSFNTTLINLSLNFKTGRALKMPENVCYINPRLYTTGNSGSNIKIHDFKIRPSSLPFSRGQLGIKNIIVSYLKNNNGKTIDKIKDFIVNKLIPYKSFFKIKEL